MEFKLLFENHPKYDLQPGDKIMIVDQKIGPVGIVFIRRKEGSKCANGIYSCKTGELLLSEAEFDDIQVITTTPPGRLLPKQCPPPPAPPFWERWAM